MTAMSKIKNGILFGMIAGLIDVIPMVLQNLSWDANLSAFSMWVVVGFLISTSSLKINFVLKGILIAFLVLIPTAVLIGWQMPGSLMPVAVMTLILGGALGSALK